MKAITVLEPWASLIAAGEKKIETRGWATKYRGKIAIHAAAKHTKLQFKEPYHAALSKHYNLHVPYSDDEIPYGKIIAIADLVDVWEVTAAIFDIRTGKPHGAVIGKGLALREVRGNEYLYGNYPVGGYAWILENVRRIEPVAVKGQQRIWNLNVPALEVAAWHSEFLGGTEK